ncbi:1-phosphatidylinositol-3-phosphate 5-kinase [Aphelenchoides fujianensis]|nr:1-phosphatidylinositol-3-phosphate 5-kinase [Aphelenchoides fujianensis]
MSTPPQLPADLALTSFPFHAQVGDEAEGGAPKEATGFGGFFRKLFVNDGGSTSTSAATTTSGSASVPTAPTAESSGNDAPVEVDTKLPPNDAAEAQGSPKRKISARISQLIRPSNGGNERELIDYDRSVFRQYWMPDSAGKECYECHEKFTTFRRRHHCRFCGQIFCGKCCNKHVSGAELGYTGMLRLCNYCLERVGIFVDPDGPPLGPPAAHTKQPGSPAVSEKLRRKNSAIPSPAVGSLNSQDASIADIPDSLNAIDKPANLKLQEFEDPLMNSTLKSTYEPSAEADEPEWVRNLNTRQDENGGHLFAPPNQSTASPSATATAAAHQSADSPQSAPPTPFELRKDWRSAAFFFDHDHVAHGPPTLQRQFDAQTEALLDHLLERERISKTVWKPLLWPLSAEIVDIMHVDTNNRPKLINILDYVHIKKLHVNGAPSVEKINGVVFSKALHHRSMLPYGENASILLLSGNISYERVVERMSSLEIIMAQERDHLRNQVDRIASRKVSLLLAEHSVSTTALEMLLDAQIGLCCNLKPTILERLARSTNADIISSLDAQFLQPRVGFCPRYYQRAVRLADGRQKNLLVLDECDPALGVSVVIRAPTLHECEAVKRILRLLLQTRYSNRCERAFIQLFNSSGPSLRSTCEECALNQNADVDSAQDASEFVATMRRTPLSNSPILRLTAPYLETKDGQSCFLRSYFKKPPFHFYRDAELEEAARVEAEAERELRQLQLEVRENQEAIQQRHVHTIHSGRFLRDPNERMPEFRARSVLLARRLNEIKREMDEKSKDQKAELRRRAQRGLPKAVGLNVDVLNPYKHQQCAFLYCAEANFRRFQNVGSFCSGPSLLVWRFYAGGEDMTIGTFLKRFCFNADYRCKECDKTMLDHFRRIIHNRAAIEVNTHTLSAKADPKFLEQCPMEELQLIDKNELVAWKSCTKCGAHSAIKTVDAWTQNLSFAKFIDYLANAVHWNSEMRPKPAPANAVAIDPELEREEDGDQPACGHCTFHEHSHLFSMFNTVTVFSVHTVRPLHVLFAPMLCTIRSRPIPCRSLLTEQKELKRLGGELFKELELATSATSAYPILRKVVEHFESLLDGFDPNEDFANRESVYSNDTAYIHSDEALTRARHFLNALVDEWNDRRGPAAATTTAANSAAPPVELEPAARLRNLCAKFTISLAAVNAAEKAEELQCLDTNSFFAAAAAAPSSAPSNGEAEAPAAQLPLPMPPLPKVQNVTLPSPFPKQHHFELPLHRGIVPIIVRDTTDAKGRPTPDIGSTIAYALASKEYADKRRQLAAQNERLKKRGSSTSSFGSQTHSSWATTLATAAVNTSAAAPAGFSPTSSFLASNLSASSLNPPGHSNEPPPLPDDPNAHSIEVDFADSKAHYYVKVYFAESFHALRDTLFVAGEAEFLRSLSRSQPWNPQGGKSGASFFRTQDERFVFKQMSRLEMESFKTCAPRYFDYVHGALNEKKLTALCKIYGVFRIGYTSKQESSQLKMDVLVMEYLFYQKNIKQMWDLKGSLRNRYGLTKTEQPVLLDENLVQDLWANQLYVNHHSKVALKQAIHNDSHFLSSQEIMDYSLLAGICQENDEVIVGIVDYMRTYTLDKRVESLVKTALPVQHLPTVISPENYCKRFCEAIDVYFAMAPDQWTCLDSTPT